jgi:hypothetical protein
VSIAGNDDTINIEIKRGGDMESKHSASNSKSHAGESQNA